MVGGLVGSLVGGILWTLVVVITDLEVGGLPSLLTDLVEDFINNIIADQTEDLDLDHSYSLTFTEGEVTISGVP